MSNTSATTAKPAAATNINLNELKKRCVTREYKHQLLSFMQEYEAMESCKRRLEDLKRREKFSAELLDILDKSSAAELMEDFKAENERINERIKDQERTQKYKAKRLMEAVERMNESGIQLNSPALAIAKRFINA